MSLLLLGAFHGINPGMGWLFAVAIGLQENRRSAVGRALLPLGLGHAVAIGVAILVMTMGGRLIPSWLLEMVVAAALLGLGALFLLRRWHPRYGGMRMGMRQLAVWSFLMASAHGAGLMVLPLALPAEVATFSEDTEGVGSSSHSVHASAVAGSLRPDPGADDAIARVSTADADPLAGIVATLLHTAGYLLVTGSMAFLVYEKLGLRLLRRAWLNFDLVWSGALIATGAAILLL